MFLKPHTIYDLRECIYSKDTMKILLYCMLPHVINILMTILFHRLSFVPH